MMLVHHAEAARTHEAHVPTLAVVGPTLEPAARTLAGAAPTHEAHAPTLAVVGPILEPAARTLAEAAPTHGVHVPTLEQAARTLAGAAPQRVRRALRHVECALSGPTSPAKSPRRS